MTDPVGTRRDGFWRRVWRQPRSRWLLGIPLGGLLAFLVGIGFWVGFNHVVESTSTLEFCTSCHEMSWVTAEYKESVHYKNASGVRAICPDCHVPKGFFDKMKRKMRATLVEVPAAFMGKIDTEEKFEKHRLELAKNVWAEMRAQGSETCMKCHAFDQMDFDEQPRSAMKRHSPRGRDEGETCIDCHEGIAHKLPEDY